MAELPEPFYDQDGITIYHGDCREILPLLPVADLILTDPPYGISYVHGAGNFPNASRHNERPVFGDDIPFDPGFLLEYDGVAIWGANHFCGHIPSYGGRWMVWDKRCQTGVNDQSDCEFVWVKGGTTGTASRICYHLWNGFLRDSERGIPRVHPTQKPVAVMSWCLSFFPKAKTVIDPFMGSGSALVACKLKGVRAIGIEVELEYCQAAVDRLSQGCLDLSA